MNYWLMKTEPSVFSFEDLTRAPKKTTGWEGVRNYQARNLMRDEMKLGDRCLIYHSNLEVPVVAGVAEIVREGYPDETALNKKSEYYDEKAAKKGESPWMKVDVKAVQAFAVPVSRDVLKSDKALADMMVLRKGARLSVQPVTKREFDRIVALGKPKEV
jgi:predicted RNA-binding protein with PUA-like domain